MSLTNRLRDIERRLSELHAGAKATVAGQVIVIEADRPLTAKQRAQMQETLAEALSGTNQRALVLDGGMRLARPTDEQVDALRQDIARVEEKLDSLLQALAEEGGEEEQGPSITLDGEDAGGERDQSQTL